jgi:hypothetical protein
MNEAEWLACTDPNVMVAYLHGRASSRKFRLFICACCRRIWRLLRSEFDRCLIEASERCADANVHDLQFGQAVRRDAEVRRLAASTSTTGWPPIVEASSGAAWPAALKVPQQVRQWITYPNRYAIHPESSAQTVFLRDVVGNPLSPRRLQPPPGWPGTTGQSARWHRRSTKNGRSTACPCSPTPLKTQAAPRPTSWRTAGGWGRMSGDAGWSIYCWGSSRQSPPAKSSGQKL